MAILYEHYEETGDLVSSIYGDHWYAQSFTPSTSHTIISVSISCHKYYVNAQIVGNLTIGIYLTDENGYPTGNALCSGTIDGSLIIDGVDFRWVTIFLDVEYILEANTQYAIVIDVRDSSATKKIIWKINEAGLYTGGVLTRSDDGGDNWITIYDDEGDGIFREYGSGNLAILPSIDLSLQALWGW